MIGFIGVQSRNFLASWTLIDLLWFSSLCLIHFDVFLKFLIARVDFIPDS